MLKPGAKSPEVAPTKVDSDLHP